MQMIPYWCAAHRDCWVVIVDKWLSDDFAAQHDAYRERRLQMPGVPHHQGNRNLAGYAQAYVRQLNFYSNSNNSS